MENLQDLDIIRHIVSDYNDDPVTYCKNCLSLNIRVLDDNNDFCDTCGHIETETTDIFTWEKMYEEKYNKKFLKL